MEAIIVPSTGLEDFFSALGEVIETSKAPASA